jgi:hypothetical protein
VSVDPVIRIVCANRRLPLDHFVPPLACVVFLCSFTWQREVVLLCRHPLVRILSHIKMPFRIPVFALFVFALFATVSPQSVNFDDDPLRCLEDDEILTDVLKTYDKLFSPEQKPLKTSVAVWIEEIAELNQEKSVLQMSVYVTAQWLDQRLAFNNLNPCEFQPEMGTGGTESTVPSASSIRFTLDPRGNRLQAR